MSPSEPGDGPMTPPEPTTGGAGFEREAVERAKEVVNEWCCGTAPKPFMSLEAIVARALVRVHAEAQRATWEAAAEFVEADRKGTMNSAVDGYIGWWAHKFRRRASGSGATHTEGAA